MADSLHHRADGRGTQVSGHRGVFARYVPWVYVVALLVSGGVLFLRPHFVLPPTVPHGVGWLLGWVLAGLGVGAIIWNVRRAWGLLPVAGSIPSIHAIRLPASWANACAALISSGNAQAVQNDAAIAAYCAAWHHFGAGMLSAEHLDPADAMRAPWNAMDAQTCILRLDALRPAWRVASANWARQQERRYWLDVVLALLDHGVMRLQHDGRLPDTAALRTERLLIGADQGPVVLAQVPALFARRIAIAIQALPQPKRETALAQWRLLQQLQVLMAASRALDEQSQAIQVLAWNPDVDLDQVEVAYVLAAAYREGMRDWLRRAAAIRLPNMALRLDEFLLGACDLLAMQGEDDIGYVEVLQPLHMAFVQFFRQHLGQLVEQADQVERDAGLWTLPCAAAASTALSQD